MSRHLDFLRNLQQLLDEGVFVATYKHALLQSIADLAIERSADDDGSMRLAVLDLAEKFIHYYWRQSAPYRGSDGILKQ
ncbi:MAG: HNH endonuclease, partial [Rhodothermales bacterium]|nr:HNH endonuclease [Rhodothermales bacterium]